MKTNRLGLYIHIPFCSRLCHYCDFAKTANFTADHIANYMDALQGQLKAWAAALPQGQKFTSVFFGGGTPGLLTDEYTGFMELVHELTHAHAEITLESNPTNVTEENIRTWTSLGFNRLSIGVQSFDDAGLKILTRDHSSGEARRALELAVRYFPKSNGDLIYGWPGQSISSWEVDLKQMIATGVNHLSLYALTYEGQTPFARAERRGVMKSPSGETLAEFYERACLVAGESGFHHEEISNWSRPNGGCDHNWLYWRNDFFVGIGAGAHGYVDDGTEIGMRYSYPGDLRQFLRGSHINPESTRSSMADFIVSTGGTIDGDRDRQSWLLEYVGCGLRCEDGVDLELVASRGFSFRPNAKIARALNEGMLAIRDQRLIATKLEWFRETAWSYEVCASMELHS